MRDVSPNNKTNIDFESLIRFLIEYIKHPIQKISYLPDWNWQSLFTVQILMSLFSGFLAGLLKFNFYRMAAGVILMPIVSTVSSLVMSLFFYYYFQFFEKRTENYRKIFTLVILSSIPFYLFQILSEYFSFVSLIGFAMSSFLSIVGLCDNFKLERKRAYKVVGFIFLLVLLTWISNNLI